MGGMPTLPVWPTCKLPQPWAELGRTLASGCYREGGHPCICVSPVQQSGQSGTRGARLLHVGNPQRACLLRTSPSTHPRRSSSSSRWLVCLSSPPPLRSRPRGWRARRCGSSALCSLLTTRLSRRHRGWRRCASSARPPRTRARSWLFRSQCAGLCATGACLRRCFCTIRPTRPRRVYLSRSLARAKGTLQSRSRQRIARSWHVRTGMTLACRPSRRGAWMAASSPPSSTSPLSLTSAVCGRRCRERSVD
mmetsp:Transcript_43394/g.139325  ORF Transcript_43394/g.139325 Transcript_43394/m.139325 type:complete len:250 (+) Transcript_43394:220-969(+)